MKLLQIGIVSLMVVACMKGWTDEVHPSFKGAKKARIIIKEDYGKAKKVSLASDIIKLTSGLLKHAGIEVVTEPVETEFTINVEVKGEALGETYRGGGYHYSGAKVKIVVLFKTKDGYKIEEKGEGREGPQHTIPAGAYQSPNDAPFWEVLKEPAIESIAKLLYKSFGITPLISSLKDKDWAVREEVAEALEKINPKWSKTDEAKKAVPEFISRLKDKNPDVRYAAAWALGRIKDNRAVESLISALKKDGFSDVRYAAAYALGEIKDSRAVKPLISVLNDKNRDVRKAAAEALGKIKDSRAVEPLISALKDKEWYGRVAAAYALGEIKDPRAVEHLISSLKDEDYSVRYAAAYALGEIKDPRAVEHLISSLKDEDYSVREAAAEALEKITGKKFGEDQKKWQKWWQENKAKYSE